jgi:trehalose-phosphatase
MNSSKPLLQKTVEEFVAHPTVLIALDFDGTLAPLVDDPEDSRMMSQSRNALEALTSLPGVVVALVSGRAIDSLLRVADPVQEWFLVGSHGIEVVPPYMKDSYAAGNLVPPGLRQAFQRVIDDHPGTRLEVKAFGLALHTRGVEETVAHAASEAAAAACDQWSDELSIRTGHGIVECSVQNATKRDGLEAIMVQSGASSTLFAGDDLTDEDGFAALGPRDVAIRVGDGVTIAPYRLANPDEVADVLWRIHDARAGLASL